jgi:hypothetical protein
LAACAGCHIQQRGQSGDRHAGKGWFVAPDQHDDFGLWQSWWLSGQYRLSGHLSSSHHGAGDANLGPAAMRPPVDFPPFRVRFFWSSRLARDPGSSWLREIVLRVYREENAAAEARVAEAVGGPQTAI